LNKIKTKLDKKLNKIIINKKAVIKNCNRPNKRNIIKRMLKWKIKSVLN